MKPFSDNIIFWDTEFTSLDPYKGELLSLAFVKPTGEELYLELEHDGEIDSWVRENILPTLTQPKVKRTEAFAKIIEFLGPTKPYLVAYVNFFDAVYFYKLIGNKDVTKNYPFHWIFLDFASMMFGQGMDPELFSGKNKTKLLTEFGIDESKYQKHNALDDARMLKEVYLKLTTDH
jgi:DNA polymerase III epsilon subunit-like protein